MNETMKKRNFIRPWEFVLDLKKQYRMPLYNLGYRISGSLDGYPLPPAELVDVVIGTKELAWYQLGGLFMHQAITTMLQRNGVHVNSIQSILDFGCGCGRIVRWWAALGKNSEIWGCDYNPELIQWCQKNLSTFAQFIVNDAEPPLVFEQGQFEFVYAYSVLTHISKPLQQPWLEELARVVKLGGYLLVTVHGKRVAIRSGFSDELLNQLEEEDILVFGEEASGTNLCAAYHSENYMVQQEKLGLTLVDYLPGGVRDSSEQDMYLFRRDEITSS